MIARIFYSKTSHVAFATEQCLNGNSAKRMNTGCTHQIRAKSLVENNYSIKPLSYRSSDNKAIVTK